MSSLIGKTFTDSNGQKWKVIFDHPYRADRISKPIRTLGAVRWMKRTGRWGTNRTCRIWGGESLDKLLTTGNFK